MMNKSKLETTARHELAEILGETLAAYRQGMNLLGQAKAEAEPVLSLVDGLKAETERINQINQQIQSTLDRLRPYSSIPHVQPFINLLTTMQPIAAALGAAQASKMALALLTLPEPSAVAMAALVAGVRAIEGKADQAVRDLLDFMEGE